MLAAQAAVADAFAGEWQDVAGNAVRIKRSGLWTFAGAQMPRVSQLSFDMVCSFQLNGVHRSGVLRSSQTGAAPSVVWDHGDVWTTVRAQEATPSAIMDEVAHGAKPTAAGRQGHWVVIGGGSKRGLLVRVGERFSSPALPMRLAIGAVVKEVFRSGCGTRIAFEKQSGEGPSSGWISIQIDGRSCVQPVAPDQIDAIGGARHRSRSRMAEERMEDQDPSVRSLEAHFFSPKVGKPDMTSLQVVSNTVQQWYPKTPTVDLHGIGTNFRSSEVWSHGEETIRAPKARSKSPQRRAVLSAAADSPQRPDREVRHQETIRVLGLHGTGSNSNIMAAQTGSLRQALGEDVEWVFLNASRIVEKDEREDIRKLTGHGEEQGPLLESLAEGMPFYAWYTPYTPPGGRHVKHGLMQNVDRIIQRIQASGPINVLVGFSESCSLVNIAAMILRDRGWDRPWRLSILFNPSNSFSEADMELLLERPLTIPAIMVFGRQDPLVVFKDQVTQLYKNPMVLEHDEGHKFPSVSPKAGEIYSAISQQVNKHCRPLLVEDSSSYAEV